MKLWDAIMATAVLIGIVLVGSQMASAEDRLSVPLPDLSGLSESRGRDADP